MPMPTNEITAREPLALVSAALLPLLDAWAFAYQLPVYLTARLSCSNLLQPGPQVSARPMDAFPNKIVVRTKQIFSARVIVCSPLRTFVHALRQTMELLLQRLTSGLQKG